MPGRRRYLLGAGVAATVIGGCVWLLLTNAAAYQFLVRLYVDRHFLKQTVGQRSVLAPVLFVALQVLQVIVAPIPGEVTGVLGGYLFGQWPGFFYSTAGLGLGSVAAFAVGRWLGAPVVRKLVGPGTWSRMGFIIEAEGAVVCFIIYLIPGLPKDMICYLFGMSPMALWAFALLSTLGRMPDTWVLSAQGAHAAAGDYVEWLLLTALVVAIALPLYHFRYRIVEWLQGSRRRPGTDRE